MQDKEPMGACRIIAFISYLAALYTTGYDPRLNPHKII